MFVWLSSLHSDISRMADCEMPVYCDSPSLSGLNLLYTHVMSEIIRVLVVRSVLSNSLPWMDIAWVGGRADFLMANSPTCPLIPIALYTFP